MLFFVISVFLLTVAGTMMDFFASALASNANSAQLLLTIFIIPQMVVSGALVPLPSSTTALASSLWPFQAAVITGGAGLDVPTDSCWDLSKDEQEKLTLDEKNTKYNCMGENSLHEASRNFSSLCKYYDSAIDQPDPVKPAEPSPQPTEPDFPPTPYEPIDVNNVLVLQKFLADLTSYSDSVSKIRDGYQKEINTWRTQQEKYETMLES